MEFLTNLSAPFHYTLDECVVVVVVKKFVSIRGFMSLWLILVVVGGFVELCASLSVIHLQPAIIGISVD